MTRRLLSLLTAVSLLLCVAAAACWATGSVRGPHATRWRVWPRPARTFFVKIEPWHLILCEQRIVPGAPLPADHKMDSTQWRTFRVARPVYGGAKMSEDYWVRDPTGAWFHADRQRVAAFGPDLQQVVMFGTGAWYVQCYYGVVAVPWWSLVLLFGLLPAAGWPASRRRRARARRGLCLNCGYDLRSTSERCPECGTEPTPALTRQ